MKFCALSLFLLILTQMSRLAIADDCLPRLVAPSNFPNMPLQWGQDSGPIINGFLDLKTKSGMASIIHGIDLSHYDDYVDYHELARCGTEFAVVKMDPMFELHRDNLKKVGIKVLPYHYLSVDATKGKEFTTHPSSFSDGENDLSNERLKVILDAAHDRGTSQARDFARSYKNRMETEDTAFDLAGLKGRFMIIDVEEHFKEGIASTSLQRRNFGRFYGAMLASWVTQVKQTFPDAIIIFYTFPDIFTSYLQYALPGDNALIHGLPVWLARTRGDGSDFDLDTNKNLQRICLSSAGGNRCILHQYSHRAIFAIDTVKNSKKKTPPYHIDVDRLFKVKEIKDQVGIQYVREEN